MRDVVVIGGGLSGLAAAAELERLQVPYRLIEVKGRLGGSIQTVEQEGFVMDTGAFAFSKLADWSFLPEFGLEDALIEVRDVHGNPAVAFKDGTQMVIDALAARLTSGTIIHRMAVSSLGRLENQYTLCMENGLMLDAAALVVAAPARHAERMFRTLQPEISSRLTTYSYDTITRVSLGYSGEVSNPGRRVWADMAIPFYYTTNHPNRVPDGQTIVYLGVRFPLEHTTPDALVQTLTEQLGWGKMPSTWQVSTWPEADPLPPHTRRFHEHMAELQTYLPDDVALAGSDYHGLGLAERIAGGRAAAQRAAAWLKRG